MKKPQVIDVLFHWVAPFVVLLCAGWFVYAMGAREKPQRKKPPVRKSIPVEVIQASPHTGTLDITANGVVIPFREVELSTRVGGEVVFKSDSLSPGHTVNEGELLLRIDDTDYKLEVARLEQEVAQADVELERLKVDRQNAERLLAINKDIVALRDRELSRVTQLRRQNATSAAENEAAELAMLTASQQATTQENLIRSFDTQAKMLQMSKDLAKLHLQRAKLDLQRTEIVAPFNGVVIANHVEQNSTVTLGSAVASIEDTSRVEVRCNLRDDDIPFIQSSEAINASAYDLPAVPVTIEYERGGRTYAWSGVLSRQDGLGLDQATRTLPVRIRVDQPTKNLGGQSMADRYTSAYSGQPLALVRGMFVKVNLHCHPNRSLAVIPESVLRPGKQVWLMRNQKLAMESIRIARIQQGHAYIDLTDSPMQMGDQIVSSPVPNARNGLPLMVKKTPPTALAADEKRKSGRTLPLTPSAHQASKRAARP